MKKHNIPRTPPQQAERYSPDVREGLSDAQAARRVSEGLNNVVSASQGKSYGRILRDNLMTLFNLLNFALAACVILVGSYSNALFIGVIICNIIIGTYQEIRAKRTIEKLQVVSAPTAHVVRGGTEREIAVGDIVLDDIAIWRAGMQISADCEVAEGEIEVNESLLTGESDALKKRPGDKLMSGSFVVSGECRARVLQYTKGIIVQTVGELEDPLDGEGMMETEDAHKKSFDRMYALLREQHADVLALGAGGCKKCAVCTYPDAPCRRPNEMVS